MWQERPYSITRHTVTIELIAHFRIGNQNKEGIERLRCSTPHKIFFNYRHQGAE